MPFIANTVIRNYGSTAANLSLKADATTIYGTGYWYGGTGNFEGVWAADPETGAIKWLADCHGDTYDSQSMNGAVYSVGHQHGCENIASFPEQNPWKKWKANAFTADVRGTVRTNTHGNYGNFAGHGAPAQIQLVPRHANRYVHRPDAGRLDGREHRRVPGHRWRVPQRQRGEPAGPGPVRDRPPRPPGRSATRSTPHESVPDPAGAEQ